MTRGNAGKISGLPGLCGVEGPGKLTTESLSLYVTVRESALNVHVIVPRYVHTSMQQKSHERVIHRCADYHKEVKNRRLLFRLY